MIALVTLAYSSTTWFDGFGRFDYFTTSYHLSAFSGVDTAVPNIEL